MGRDQSSTPKIALLCFEKDKEKLENVRRILDAELVFYSKDVWDSLMDYDCIVAYIASGIVVRGICGKLKSKWEDPAVVVLDKPLKHAFVLLGGHHGGNEVALKLEQIGIKAVITTAMEYSEGLSLGIGFRRETKADEIMDAIQMALKEVGAEMDDLRVIATLETKRDSAIVEVADRLKRPLVFVRADEINKMDVRETKAIKIGVKNVSEACAIYVSKKRELILPKRIYGGVTVAIAR